VNHQDQYLIPFKGLFVGAHSFEWTMNKEFFSAYEMSEIDDADIKANVALVKHTQFLEIDIALEGWAKVQCDRCLDPLLVDIETEAKLIVKFGHISGEEDSDDNDVIILSYDDNELNMTHYLYEYAHLALPIRRVHPDDPTGKSTCNQEMIRQLEQYLVSKQEHSGSDPRWKDIENIFKN
jgi:uncharacterized metal-binding protein YceD (DUF177 family)